MNKIVYAVLTIILFASCNDQAKQENKSPLLKQLISPVDSVSAEPYLFTDKNGLVYLSWIEKTKDSSLLKFAVLSNEEWSQPVTIISGNNWFVNWADYPMIASDGDSNLIAHFLQKSGKSTYAYDIKLITSADKGRSWSDAKILHDDGKQAEHGFVSMLPYKEHFFIAWLDGRNSAMEHGSGHEEGHHGQMTIRAAILNKQGGKVSEWELDGKVCDCCQTSSTHTSNGPVVVYRDRTDEEIRDISIVRLVNGNWTKPKPIFADQWKIAGCPVNGPRSDAEGNTLAIAWFSSPDAKPRVNIIFSEDGGETFDKPIRVDEGNALGRVDVVMLDENSAMVSWMEGPVIKAARIYKDGKKDASMIISSSSESRSGGFPQMTKSGMNVIFAWTDIKMKTIKLARLAL
jgi:hypothetical protein